MCVGTGDGLGSDRLELPLDLVPHRLHLVDSCGAIRHSERWRWQLGEGHQDPQADAAAEGYKRWFVSRLKLLESTLEDREYLCSNRFTIADICVSYAIYLAGTLGIEQAFKPNIKRWTDMLFEREAFKKVINYKYDGPGPSGPEELQK